MIRFRNGLKRFQKTSITLLTAIALALAGCGGGSSSSNNNVSGIGSPGGLSTSACSVDTEKQEVLQIMQQWYLFNDEAAQFNKYQNINLNAFADGDALLDFLRYLPNQFDRGFSFISTPAEDEAFFGRGEFGGFGFSLVQTGFNDFFIRQVFSSSPAGQAGIERGYRLTAIDGRTIAQINAAEGVSAALGPAKSAFRDN